MERHTISGYLDFYVVGNNGSIDRCLNGQWIKIESGTTTNIDGLWGVNSNSESTVFCTVSSFFEPGDMKILKIKDNIVDSVSWNVNEYLSGVWTNNERYVYVCGDGVYNNKKVYWEKADLPAIATNDITGNGLNSIITVGDFGFAAYFNGYRWKTLTDIYNAAYYSVSVKDNLVAMVGERNGKGIVTIGIRN